MKGIILLSALLLAANVAIAAEKSSGKISEFHQHAMGGQIELTPELDYRSMTVEANAGPGKAKISGFRLGTEAEYGVAERLSVGADLFYDTLKNKPEPAGTETKQTGLEDVILFARGSSEMGTGRLAYGLNLGLSLGKSIIKANGDSNVQSGGMSLNPYVGYEMDMGAGILGGQIDYTWLGDRKEKDEGANTESTTKDGNAVGLAAFYEHAFTEMVTVGASLDWQMNAETKEDGVAQQDKYDQMTFSLYAPISTSETMTIIPRLDYVNFNYKNNTAVGIKDPTAFQLGVAARILL